MAIINIYEAKTHLSRLVDRAEAGEEIIIARNGKPAARLVPVAKDNAPRVPGSMRGLIHVPDDFNDPDREFEALFYGETEEEIAKDKLWYSDWEKEPKAKE